MSLGEHRFVIEHTQYGAVIRFGKICIELPQKVIVNPPRIDSEHQLGKVAFETREGLKLTIDAVCHFLFQAMARMFQRLTLEIALEKVHQIAAQFGKSLLGLTSVGGGDGLHYILKHE